MVTPAIMLRLAIPLFWNRLLMATNCSLNVFQAVGSRSEGKCSATERFSKMDWALISRNSSSTSSWSSGRPRSLDRLRRASASRPWWMSQRGEKGMKIIPTRRIRQGPSWRQMGTSQAASDWVASEVPPM